MMTPGSMQRVGSMQPRLHTGGIQSRVCAPQGWPCSAPLLDRPIRYPLRTGTSRLVDHYESLSQSQLVNLLRKRDQEKKLGLVWERDDLEADAAIDANFIASTLDGKLSDGVAPWRNLVIEADNFDALRWLRMTYARRIKCIYVDPPYNTGEKDWVYNDHYVDRNDRYRFSTWLEFLFQRFQLARELLTDDGVIFVSINDENRAKLELMLDEALPGMRLGSFTWRTRPGGNDTKGAFLSDNHEHILIYGAPGFRFGGTEKTFELYRHWDEIKNDWFRTGGDLTQPKNYQQRKNSFYPIHDPKTDVWYPCNPDSVWRYVSRFTSPAGSKIRTQFIEDLITSGYIHFPSEQRLVVWKTRKDVIQAIKDRDVPSSSGSPMLRPRLTDVDFWVGKTVGFGTPSLKRYKKELKNLTQPLSSWITPNFEKDSIPEPSESDIVAGTGIESAKTIKDIFGQKAFNYAKPVSLIREIIRQSTSPDDLVADFFAGSATTAHAVMELNAEDGGNRRFIMVSSTEKTSDQPKKNLCRDVTAERIRRLNSSDKGKYGDLSAGFAYLRCREIEFDAINQELDPEEAWIALEAMHGLPITKYDASLPWNEHFTSDLILILADKTDESLISRLHQLIEERANVFVYSWAPGQVRTALGHETLEVYPVRESLVKRFMA
ncbi:MAG: site-specific DNA-methyltransferase [Cytophagaceae bacterium]|nr:MAG: site-specific DNA-methyltransferase [Cytophagaceae bacterium]